MWAFAPKQGTFSCTKGPWPGAQAAFSSNIIGEQIRQVPLGFTVRSCAFTTERRMLQDW